MQRQIRISADLEALSTAAAKRWVALASEAIAARGEFHVALSGGATPRRLYERLAAAPFAREIDWLCVHIYFTDERCVPPDHQDSNFWMASEALLRHVLIPPEQIHRIGVTLATIRQDAAAYAELLRKHLPKSVAPGVPQFDLVLLGLGPDGHIASLFPAAGIAVTEREDRYAVAVYADRLKAWRISLSLPVIAHAEHILMLAAGKEKTGIVRRALGAPESPPLPVQRLQPVHEMEWYLDEAAAAQLHDRVNG
ncbi:MAG: 6-phosphogluconolactonase [Gammaproteobacteria bacterium]|nr:6-phosphogluconolactonase [Gammaproteobacteria bacterium]